VDVSGVLSSAWELYRRFFARFALTAGAVYVVLDFVGAVGATAGGDDVGDAVWVLLSLVLSIIGIFWVQGALAEAVRDVRDGKADVGVSELYSRTRPRLPALISAGVLAGLGIAVGFVLLIVPGLYLLTRWALIVPVIVLEGKSAGESFSRSWELVKGNGWSVLGLVVLTFIGVAVANQVIVALFGWLPTFLAAWLGALVAHSLTVPFAACTLTLAYYRLIELKGQPAGAPATA
jgi:hypothetical protein